MLGLDFESLAAGAASQGAGHIASHTWVCANHSCCLDSRVSCVPVHVRSCPCARLSAPASWGVSPARIRPLVGCPCAQATLQGSEEHVGLPSVVVWRHSHSALTSCLNAAASTQEVAAVTTGRVLNSLGFLRVCCFAHVTEVQLGVHLIVREPQRQRHLGPDCCHDL